MTNDIRAQSAHAFWQLPLGIQLAAAALVVAVPRYVIAFLAADNLRFPSLVEGALLGVSAIATAIIVAGGGAYTAHVVSSASGQAGKRALLLALWLVLLACEIVLLAPPVVASLRKSELAHVLLAQFYFDALWSVVMVATPALCAAACVLAASLDTNRNSALSAAEELLLAASKLDEAEDRYTEVAAEAQGSTEREFIPRSMRRSVKERCAHVCQYCQRPGTPENDPDGEAWHIDHVIPVVRGGPTTPDNLTLSCAHCNLQKGALPPFAFLARTIAARSLPEPETIDTPIPQSVPVTSVTLHCPNECGRSFASQQALAGHLRYCNAQLATQSVKASGNGAH